MPLRTIATDRVAAARMPGSRCLRRILVLALAAGTLLAPAGAFAAGWTRPVGLSGPAGASRLPDERVPEVAVNRRGESIAAWGAKSDSQTILVASGDARGRFGRPERVGRGYLSSVAIADDGTAFVAWAQGRAIKVAARPRNRQFAAPQTLAVSEGKSFVFAPTIDVDHRGNALVAWTARRGAAAPGDTLGERVEMVFRRRGRTFGAPTTIAAGAGSVVFDEDDRVVAAVKLSAQSGGTFPVPFVRTSVAQVVSGSPRGPFTAPVTLSASPTSDVRMAIGVKAEVGIGWESAFGPESDPYGPIQTSIGAPTGRFVAPVNAPVARADRAFGPLVAFGGAGELVTIWQENVHPSSDFAAPLYWAARRAGAPFGPRSILAGADVTQPVLASTGDGRAVMVWSFGSLRSALYRSATGFDKISAPRGRAQRFRAIRLAATGDFTVLGWRDADGRLRASVRKLPR